MDLPRPDTALPHLADVTPALLSAAGSARFEDRIGLPGRKCVARPVLLIDGLGAELLDTFAADAPVLAGLGAHTFAGGLPGDPPSRAWRPWGRGIVPADTAWWG